MDDGVEWIDWFSGVATSSRGGGSWHVCPSNYSGHLNISDGCTKGAVLVDRTGHEGGNVAVVADFFENHAGVGCDFPPPDPFIGRNITDHDRFGIETSGRVS